MVAEKKRADEEETRSLLQAEPKRAKTEAGSREAADAIKRMAGQQIYRVGGGLRKVVPYSHAYDTYVKGRWLGKTLEEVFATEFCDRSLAYYKAAITAGSIRIDGQHVAPSHVVRNGERLTHVVHRHEPPVSAEPVLVLQRTEDYVVVTKPSSIPCHPTGRYMQNSLIHILENEHGLRNPFLCNRLDRLTSGVMVLPLKQELAAKLCKEFMGRQVRKEYLCRVVGEFPTAPTEVDEPIVLVDHKSGINRCCRATGKPALTRFERLSYNGRTSVVRCFPETGRTHQIRLHLQHLGHPILNDPLYNHGAWDVLDPADPHFVRDLVAALSHRNIREHVVKDEEYEKRSSKRDDTGAEHEDNGGQKPDLDVCPDCIAPMPDPHPLDLDMWLHCKRYSGDGWEHSCPPPAWADAEYDDRPAIAWHDSREQRPTYRTLRLERKNKLSL